MTVGTAGLIDSNGAIFVMKSRTVGEIAISLKTSNSGTVLAVAVAVAAADDDADAAVLDAIVAYFEAMGRST